MPTSQPNERRHRDGGEIAAATWAAGGDSPLRLWGSLCLWCVIAVVALGCGMTAPGCTASTRISGAESTYRRTVETVAPPTPNQPTVTREIVEARSRGASGASSGDKGELKIDTTARQTVNGYAAGGGGAATGAAAIGGSSRVWLVLSGITSLAVAAAFTYRRNIRGAIAAGGLGVALIALAYLPAYVLAVAGAAVLAAWLLSERHAARTHEALRAVVAGVSSSPPYARDEVKKHVAEQADDRDRAVIATIKREDGLDVLEADKR